MSTTIELTGKVLTLESLERECPQFIEKIDPTTFSNINDFYLQLQNRGSLTLKNSQLYLPVNNYKFFLACHTLKLINSKIYFNSTDAAIICNNYDHNASQLISFDDKNVTAEHGKDGTAPGQIGSFGYNGLDGANVNLFATDKVISNGGITVDLSGQAGGNGGDGAKGANGANGLAGRDCKNGSIPGDCAKGCGDGHDGLSGGQGGSGGDGGEGGDGGKLLFKIHGGSSIGNYFFNFSADGGSNGQQGLGSDGGDGGNGGRAGKSSCSHCNGTCRAGKKGAKGQVGLSGKPGKAGKSNLLNNSTFEITFMKNFLSTWNNTKKESEEFIYAFSTGLADKIGK